MTAHISQMLEENTLFVEGDEGLIHIDTVLESGGARRAVKAVEYCIGENDQESERTIEVGEAVMTLASSTSHTRPATVDNQYAVVDAGELRVLCWENTDGVICTIDVFDTY